MKTKRGKSYVSTVNGDVVNSKRVSYITDYWGGRDETHIEIKWHGQTLMIDIDDKRVDIMGPLFHVNQHSMNAVTIRPIK